MKYNEIIGLMQEMNKAGLSKLMIENENFKLLLEKNTGIETATDTDFASPVIKDTKTSDNIQDIAGEDKPLAKNEDIQDNEKQELKKIVAPMVGTFYAKPAPDKPPYVKAGDTVKKGQIVCIIEAMKLMNEIESEVDGVIVECLVENEEMVAYGQPLFLVK